jgi:hypothetical protein
MISKRSWNFSAYAGLYLVTATGGRMNHYVEI